MPSHKLHMKWEKKLGLPSDKKLHEIVDGTFHDAIGVKEVDPTVPWAYLVKDMPKRMAEKYYRVVSGLHLILEEIREYYGSPFVPPETLKRLALHLLLDGIADTIRENLGLERLEKFSPEKIIDMGYDKMHRKMYKKGSPVVRDPQERMFSTIAVEILETLKEHSPEVLEDILSELKSKGRLRKLGYKYVYDIVSQEIRSLKPYFNYPPGFNIEVLIKQIAGHLSRGEEIEIPLMWDVYGKKSSEIIKVSSLEEFLEKLKESKEKLGIR